MKQCWLFAGFAMMFMILSQSALIAAAIAICSVIFQFRHFSKGHILYLVFISLAFIRVSFQAEHNVPYDNIFKIMEVKNNYLVARNRSDMVILYGLTEIGIHDIVEVKGTYQLIDSVHNFHQFHFADWCHRRGIYYSVQAKTHRILEKGKDMPARLYDVVKQKNEKTKDFILQFLYGIADNDIVYFVTASGMHIVTIWYLIKKLLLCMMKRQSAQIVCFIGMCFLSYMTVFSGTIWRVLCFQFISMIIPNADQKDNLGISMYILLLLTPYMAWEMSFLIPVAFRFVSIFRIHPINKQIQTLFVLIPIQFYFLQQVSLTSILLFKPLRYINAFIYIIAWLAVFIPIPVDFIMNIVRQLSHVSLILPGFFYAPPVWWLLLWCSFVIRYITYKKELVLYKLCCLFLFTQYAQYLNPFASVMMLDVGQGDCFLIQYPFQQKTVMIDVMGSLYKDIPNDIIIPILKAKHINRIDTLIITHEDYDHSGGVAELTKQIPVTNIIDSKAKAKVLHDPELKFLNLDWKGNNKNDNSLITYLSLYGTTFLFMGDAGVQSEEQLLKNYPNIKADVLKAGHHGARTSSSPSFIHQVHPLLTLLSAGRNNRYQHPHQEVLDLLRDEESFSLLTSKEGAIDIKICKYFSFFKTAGNDFGIIKIRW